MTDGFSIASLVLSSCVLAGTVCILGFALYGVSLRRRARTASSTGVPTLSFLVLIPAHNESAGIAATIQSVRGARYPSERLRVIVLADNCTDSTGTIARNAGAEVLQRDDAANPGKGQALEWAFTQLAAESFDFAAVIDADTLVDPQFFSEIAAFAVTDQQKHPVAVYQGRYEFARVPGQQAKGFETLTLAAKAAENSFTYLPRSSAGLFNLLQGNGFCISHAALQEVPFRAGSVVEDAEYALHLAVAGVPVRYVDAARVHARMTSTVRDAAPQRLRWASGIFALIGRSSANLLRAGFRRRSWRLVEAALMLLLTSRVLLVGLTLNALILAGVMLPDKIARISLALIGIAILLQASYLLLIFRRAADRPFPMAGIVAAPFYFIFVSAMQALAITGFRRKRWSRTVR